ASREGCEIIARALPAYRLGDLASVFAAEYGARIVVVGRRLGEQTHEALVSPDEAPFTRKDGTLFIITPGRRQGGAQSYSSLHAPRLGYSELHNRVGFETV